MTENEAKEKLKRIRIISGRINGKTEILEAVKVAIKALEDIQQYREFGMVQEIKELIADWVRYRELGTVEEIKKKLKEELPYMSIAQSKFKTELDTYKAIGTVEELREAMEKQRAKKPVKRSFIIPYEGIEVCPNCKRPINKEEHHCRCGQAID